MRGKLIWGDVVIKIELCSRQIEYFIIVKAYRIQLLFICLLLQLLLSITVFPFLYFFCFILLAHAVVIYKTRHTKLLFQIQCPVWRVLRLFSLLMMLRYYSIISFIMQKNFLKKEIIMKNKFSWTQTAKIIQWNWFMQSYCKKSVIISLFQSFLVSKRFVFL